MSRRPRGTHWTQKELQAIRSDWKGETLADGGGLFGEVRIGPDGGIFIPFRYSFRFDGKKQWFYAGSWPSVDMSEIRARRNKAREDVQQGINPKDRKLIEASEREQALVQAVEDGKQAKDDRLTLDDLFKVWVANGVARKDDNKELKRSFQKDVLPEIGHVELRLLTDHAITLVLRKILSRDVIRIAILVLDDITQMLSWAEKRQPWRRLLENGNPALLNRPGFRGGWLV
ncbi:DUF4102 domain-containing protein [Alcaligenaceae bacterium]|nr:DUF4102 domain-containing protein [Alcaligenaceae bacterium]